MAVVLALWMGWAGCSGPWEDVGGNMKSPSPRQHRPQDPPWGGWVTHHHLWVTQWVRSCPCPHGSGAGALRAHIMTGACPLPDVEPVSPGAEHPGAQQPPGSPG